jgi:hypothetical protein
MTKPQTKMEQPDHLSRDALQAFDNLFGLHPGYRPVHAKGILLSGTFTPSSSTRTLTGAPHVSRPPVPIALRVSDFSGIPAIPDYDENASPRGFAVRFYLTEHVHTDIIAHSVDAFPTRTAEEFVEFLRAIGAKGPGGPKPTPTESFLATRPAALAFVQAPKRILTSSAKESFYSVSVYKFTNNEGVSKSAATASFLGTATIISSHPRPSRRTRVFSSTKLRTELRMARSGCVSWFRWHRMEALTIPPSSGLLTVLWRNSALSS